MIRRSKNRNLIKLDSWCSQKKRMLRVHVRLGKVKFSQPVRHKSKLLYQKPTEYKTPGFLKGLLEAK